MGNAQISDLVKEKYKMAGNFMPGIFIFKGNMINMSTVDLDTLDKAVAKGFDVVELLPVDKKTKKGSDQPS